MLDNLPASFAPVLLVALGAFVSELAGVLNISVEGLMLLGSFLGVLGLGTALGPIPSLFVAFGAGMIAGLFLGFLQSRMNANIFIAGIGLNLLAASLVNILGQSIFGTKGVVTISGAPMDGLVLMQLGLALVIFLFLFLSYSYSLMGIRFRSLANHSEMLYARGVNIKLYRVWALAISGGLASLGGAFMSHNIGAYVPQGTMGKGWIALVLVYAGAKHPLGILAAVIAFVGMEELSVSLQHNMEHPGLAIGTPYLLVLILLILVQLFSRKKLDL